MGAFRLPLCDKRFATVRLAHQLLIWCVLSGCLAISGLQDHFSFPRIYEKILEWRLFSCSPYIFCADITGM